MEIVNPKKCSESSNITEAMKCNEKATEFVNVKATFIEIISSKKIFRITKQIRHNEKESKNNRISKWQSNVFSSKYFPKRYSQSQNKPEAMKCN
jgi:hypothetical protein